MKDVHRSVLVTAIGLALAIPRLALAQTAAPVPQAGAVPTAQTADVKQVKDEVDRLRQEFDALRKQYEDRLFALEQRLSQIGGGPLVLSPVTLSSAPVPAETPAPAQPVQTTADAPPPAPQDSSGAQAVAASSKVFNPDTSVIANFLGVAGKNPFGTPPSMQMSEVEASFQAVVDPYARADFFLSVSPEGIDVEEGYITFTTLPANLLLKVGKMRANFGKVNTLHTHAMPSADRPLVTDNLVGGEEGLSDAGFSLAHLINNKYLFMEVTGEVFRGDSAVFQSPQRSKLNYVGRFRAYHDLTENSNLDLGTSVAFGPTDVGLTGVPEGETAPVLNKRLIGFDASFHYRPLRRAIYHRLNLRTELIWSQQNLVNNEQADAFGYYGLVEYQFARRWYVGGRFDRSGRVLDGTLHDNGGSIFVTFWPSEFSQIRGQYRRTNYAQGATANELLFQFLFSIGAHGAHTF
jgi:hypothetical protein